MEAIALPPREKGPPSFVKTFVFTKCLKFSILKKNQDFIRKRARLLRAYLKGGLKKPKAYPETLKNAINMHILNKFSQIFRKTVGFALRPPIFF